MSGTVHSSSRLRIPSGHLDMPKAVAQQSPSCELSVGDVVRTVQGEMYVVRGELGKGRFGVAYRCIRYANGSVDMRTKAVVKVQADLDRVMKESYTLDYLQTSASVIEHLVNGPTLGSTSEGQGSADSSEEETEDLAEKHNIIKLIDTFIHRGLYCILLESMPTDLDKHLNSQPFRRFSRAQTSNIAKQILVALSHLKDRRLIHADLKLDNILVDPSRETWRIKLADFGWTFFTTDAAQYQGRDIQPVPHRAPEIFVGAPFDEAIDMWGVGTICGSMYFGLGCQLFKAHERLLTLQVWTKLLGDIPNAVLDGGKHTAKYYNKHSTGSYEIKTHIAAAWDINDILYQVKICKQSDLTDEAFAEFLFGCLKMDPAERLVPNDALQLGFVQGTH